MQMKRSDMEQNRGGENRAKANCQYSPHNALPRGLTSPERDYARLALGGSMTKVTPYAWGYRTAGLEKLAYSTTTFPPARGSFLFSAKDRQNITAPARASSQKVST